MPPPAGAPGGGTGAGDRPDLRPEPDEAWRATFTGRAGRRMVHRVRVKLFLALAAANVMGVAVVVACITWVLPGPELEDTRRIVAMNAILGGIYLVTVVPAGVLWGEAWLRTGRRWMHEERAPTDREVVAVLRAPGQTFLVHLTVWLLAAGLFGLLNGLLDVTLLARVVLTVALGGLTTSAIAYLLAERLTRPLARAALSVHSVRRPSLPGITTRTLLGWLLGTGVPLLGLITAAVFALVEDDATTTQLAVTMIVLAGTGLLVGVVVATLGARAVADPITELREGMERITDGDLDAAVEVYDGSVLGLLQSGFNEMAAGLRERERLRDLYGRQVGREAADHALERGVELGGAVRDVAVVFVDVVGSTELAASRPPEEVVGLLNRFFTVVIDEVDRHGGWVNKFQGDATLAVFGAPAPLDDAPGRALAAARGIARRLPREAPELSAGIGITYGPAVAGNIGDERRFELTVIGDPVNEAARLTEAAKGEQPQVLASTDAVEAAGPDERCHWVVDGSAHLRGRARPTRLARPRHLRP